MCCWKDTLIPSRNILSFLRRLCQNVGAENHSNLVLFCCGFRMVSLAKSNQNLRRRRRGGGGWASRTDVRTLLHDENRFPQLLLRPKLTAKRLRRRRRANKGKAGKDSCRQFFGLKTAFLEKPIEVTTDNASVSFYSGFSVGMQTSKARTTDGRKWNCVPRVYSS